MICIFSNLFRIHSAGNNTTYFVELLSVDMVIKRFTLERDFALDIERRLMGGEPVTYNFNRCGGRLIIIFLK
ncbi:MAG: hypothetical protein GY820_03480 [Gammaproteobacteria bacterium]|nr:hypothetical protein [Gammaproteobacteria bacterium]